MKRIRIAIVLLAAVIGLCVLTNRYQHRRITELFRTLDHLEEAYQQGRIVEAVSWAEKLTADFSAVSDVMSCYVPHEALAEGRQTAAMLPALLRQDGEEELVMELCRLREQLDFLQQVDDLKWQNIL